MTVATLIQNINTISVTGNTATDITGIILDSRQVASGCMFFAQQGTKVDGHQFIEGVIAGGAQAIVCERLPQQLHPEVCYIQVQSVAEITGIVAAQFFGQPSRHFKLIGVTGTNGKTTVATLLYQLFSRLGHHCGLISTVQNHIGEKAVASTHTTPDAISLQSLLKQMQDAGCAYVFMEVSSHAIHQHRIAGILFEGGVFTNITHDHLDYHKTFDAYIRVKKSFFDHLPKTAFALTNPDDKRGAVMLQNTEARKASYALRAPAEFKGRVLENGAAGLLMEIEQQQVHFRMIGLFNAYNLLAVYAVARLLDQDKTTVLSLLSDMKGARGRFETYISPHKKIIGIVDYAHTPDALLNVLSTIKQFGMQEVITVVGCGGDRDRSKRPLMAQVACSHSSRVILTSDNPRSEDPEAILDEMESGLNISQKRKTLRISNRKSAIQTACSLAAPESIILIAGKGHETYQEIKGERKHFDDKEVLLDMFELLSL